ncbi:hypothetical protein DV735_g2645, partial [Chaetothyriales sp. CBS 134920]
MPFAFLLSTTSQLSFESSLTSSTHPSLPSAATSRRSLVRSSLKEHKRLSAADQASHLPDLALVLDEYLKYLISIDVSLSGRPISGEEVDLALVNEVEVEWRPTLSTSTLPGRDSDRVKARGLDFELYFAHHTLALVHSLLASQSLVSIYASVTPTPEERTQLIQNATKRLRAAHSLHAYLGHRSNSSPDGPPLFPPAAVDISPGVQSALQNLAHAELNLLAVLKDDPYPAVVIQSRNKDDREWMFKSPSIPRVAAQVRRRLCVGAADKAEAALASLRSSTAKISKDLIEYCQTVRRTAKAKACRFAALDADLSGETGKAIAWLRAAMHELGIDPPDHHYRSTPTAGLKKLKTSWTEKREDRRLAKAADSGGGSSGGSGWLADESRILDFLDRKLTKENDTINVQPVPDWRPLLSTMPTGMHITINDRWLPTPLSEDELIAMRSLPEEAGAAADHRHFGHNSSDAEDKDEGMERRPAAGADYATAQSTYY